MKHLIIGTAGHVDHGKSALIKALTGVDTDRLKEEKQRGISIDLGFASLKVIEDIMAGIVDVPGHERFLKNMLAGTGGIDLVLLVIAADEGVMPQTQEHLAMLNLYGICNGIVVVNKIDKVDADWLELVEDDIKSILKGTFLEKSPFCRVSAVTGDGLEKMRAVLQDMARLIKARDFNAPFRLWIDRVFSMKGHGVVVTGSALTGIAKVGDTLSIYPLNRQVRVRGLEWHGEKAETVAAGQRSAINLAGVNLEEISRGMVLSSASRGESSNVWDVSITWLEEVTTNTRIRLHIGTGEYLGRIHLYKDKPAQYCRLILEQQLSAGAGDRGILRLYSPQKLLGGVLLIAPTQKGKSLGKLRIQMAKTLIDGDSENLVQVILTEVAKPMAVEEIMRRSGYITDSKVIASLENLIKENKACRFGGVYISSEALQALTIQLKEMLQKHHQAEPKRQGLPREIIRQRLHLEEKDFESLYEFWQKQNMIIVYGAEIALTEHKTKHSNWQQEVVSKAEKVLASIGLNAVDLAVIEQRFQMPADNARKIHDTLVKGGILIRIGELYLTKMIIEEVLHKLQQHFRQQATITVAQMRDMLNTSRKIAMPLLEYFDGQRYTIREGDARRAGSKLGTKSS